MNRSAPTFTYLICMAFGVALLGLGANLMHLKELMNTKDDNDLTRPILRGGGGGGVQSRALQDVQTEEQVFSRLLKESVSHLEECGPAGESSNNAATTARKLGRFGFMNALNNQVLIPSSLPSKQQCHNAPTTACHATSYVMIVATSGTNLRTLFLNLLSWLTYANVAQLIVIMPPAANATLAQDSQYGQRILAWHADSSHKITLEVASSLWTPNYSLLLQDNGSRNNDDTHDAVVWMNGDVVDNGNHRGLDSGLELWKQHANAVVASQGWKVTKEASTSQRRLEEMSTNITIKGSSTPAFCKHETITATSADNDAKISIPDLHGLFVHRNYLCFLSHSVLKQLHRVTENLQEERLAVAMLLQQVSGQAAARLFPQKVRSEGVPEKRKLTRDSASSISSSPTSLLSSIFRSGSDAARRLLEEEERDIELLELMEEEEPDNSRRLSEAVDELDSDFVTAVAGFFGSLPTKSIGWCNDCSDETGEMGDVPIHQIHWLTQTCGKVADYYQQAVGWRLLSRVFDYKISFGRK